MGVDVLLVRDLQARGIVVGDNRRGVSLVVTLSPTSPILVSH